MGVFGVGGVSSSLVAAVPAASLGYIQLLGIPNPIYRVSTAGSELAANPNLSRFTRLWLKPALVSDAQVYKIDEIEPGWNGSGWVTIFDPLVHGFVHCVP